MNPHIEDPVIKTLLLEELYKHAKDCQMFGHPYSAGKVLAVTRIILLNDPDPLRVSRKSAFVRSLRKNPALFHKIRPYLVEIVLSCRNCNCEEGWHLSKGKAVSCRRTRSFKPCGCTKFEAKDLSE